MKAMEASNINQKGQEHKMKLQMDERTEGAHHSLNQYLDGKRLESSLSSIGR